MNIIDDFNYDPEVDAAMYNFGGASEISEEIVEDVVVDYNDKDEIVGVELLYVSKINPDRLQILDGKIPAYILRFLIDFIVNLATEQRNKYATSDPA